MSLGPYPEVKTSLVLKSDSGEGLGLGLRTRGLESPEAWPRKERRASRQARPGFILGSRLGPLASAQCPGASYTAQWGFPHGQSVGEEEATREHVTTQKGQDTQEPESPPHLAPEPCLLCQSAAFRSGYLLPNINSKCSFKPNTWFPAGYFLERDRVKVVFVDETEQGGPRQDKQPSVLHPEATSICPPILLTVAFQRSLELDLEAVNLSGGILSSVATALVASDLFPMCLCLDKVFSTTQKRPECLSPGSSARALPRAHAHCEHDTRAGAHTEAAAEPLWGPCGEQFFLQKGLSDLCCPRPSQEQVRHSRAQSVVVAELREKRVWSGVLCDLPPWGVRRCWPEY